MPPASARHKKIGVQSGLNPGALELEITESALLESDNYTVTALTELSQMGIGLSIDDFGTGYCALSYLRKFKFDRMKLDRSFVDGVAASADALALASAIISIARSLEMGCVAEGIETEEQATLISDLGCDELQGFLISPAVSPEEFTKFLDRDKDDGRRSESGIHSAKVN